jgi:TolA-binding protein
MPRNGVPSLQEIQATLNTMQSQVNKMQDQFDDMQDQLSEILILQKNVDARFVNSNALSDDDPIKPVWKDDNSRPEANRMPETYRDFKNLGKREIVHLLTFYDLPTAGGLGDIQTRLRKHLGMRK